MKRVLVHAGSRRCHHAYDHASDFTISSQCLAALAIDGDGSDWTCSRAQCSCRRILRPAPAWSPAALSPYSPAAQSAHIELNCTRRGVAGELPESCRRVAGELPESLPESCRRVAGEFAGELPELCRNSRRKVAGELSDKRPAPSAAAPPAATSNLSMARQSCQNCRCLKSLIQVGHDGPDVNMPNPDSESASPCQS